MHQDMWEEGNILIQERPVRAVTIKIPEEDLFALASRMIVSSMVSPL